RRAGDLHQGIFRLSFPSKLIDCKKQILIRLNQYVGADIFSVHSYKARIRQLLNSERMQRPACVLFSNGLLEMEKAKQGIELARWRFLGELQCHIAQRGSDSRFTIAALLQDLS